MILDRLLKSSASVSSSVKWDSGNSESLRTVSDTDIHQVLATIIRVVVDVSLVALQKRGQWGRMFRLSLKLV